MRIGIDVDDVVADLLTIWLRRVCNHKPSNPSGRMLTPDDLTQWEFDKDLGIEREVVLAHLTPDIYDAVPMFPEASLAIDAIEAMGHDVVFVTSCPNIEHYEAKMRWLTRYNFLDNGAAILAVGPWAAHQSKATAPVQWLVDDNIENVESFPGYSLLMTRPHNRRHTCTRKRIKSLWEVVEELKLVKAARQDGRRALPTGRQARKNIPLVTGCLDYFSAALAEVAKVSLAGNKQHFTDEPLHWQRGLSADHADAAGRHLVERGTLDEDGARHSAKLAWRALALLQEELEAEGLAPMSRASRPAA